LAKNAENQTAPMPNDTIVAAASHHQFIWAMCWVKKLQKVHELMSIKIYEKYYFAAKVMKNILQKKFFSFLHLHVVPIAITKSFHFF